MTLTVRPAEPGDAAEMAALLNEIIAIGGTTAYEDPFEPADLYASLVAAETILCCHVALSEGRVVGFQALETEEGSGVVTGYIATFARQTGGVPGVGRALFPITVAAAREAGLTEIIATIRADNKPGLGYYSRIGFVDHEVHKGVPLKDGTPVDRISKRYAL